jgi:hypothetical protein
LEQASEQDVQGAKTMQVENNNKEVASIPKVCIEIFMSYQDLKQDMLEIKDFL